MTTPVPSSILARLDRFAPLASSQQQRPSSARMAPVMRQRRQRQRKMALVPETPPQLTSRTLARLLPHMVIWTYFEL
jgi:hypothetical protein